MPDIKLTTQTVFQDYSQFKDITFTPNGDVAQISGPDYARQKIGKVLMTSFYKVFPNYGANISGLLNTRLSASTLEVLKNSIISSLIYLETVEPSEDLSERIDTINKLDITFNTNEVIIDLEVVLASGKGLELAFGI